MFLRGTEQVPCPDQEAGLWVSNRAGSFQQVLIPPDALAFQLGQAGQVRSAFCTCTSWSICIASCSCDVKSQAMDEALDLKDHGTMMSMTDPSSTSTWW